MPQLERSAGLELRFASDDTETGIIEGLAASWDRRDAFGDLWQRGAFTRTLAEHRSASTVPLMLWSHDPSRPIGRWTDMREDERGLLVRGQLALRSTAGRDAYELLRAGALDGLSVGFKTRAATAMTGGRKVQDVDLIEVSLVSRPAQSAARVHSVRCLPPDAALAGLASYITARAAAFKRG